jgi:hypothetical protein
MEIVNRLLAATTHSIMLLQKIRYAEDVPSKITASSISQLYGSETYQTAGLNHKPQTINSKLSYICAAMTQEKINDMRSRLAGLRRFL